MKRAPSAVELQQDLDELIAEVTGTVRPQSLYIRERPHPHRVFPLSGYTSWQQRWLQGTGRTPKDWPFSH